jgi:hypothetical protein
MMVYIWSMYLASDIFFSHTKFKEFFLSWHHLCHHLWVNVANMHTLGSFLIEVFFPFKFSALVFPQKRFSMQTWFSHALGFSMQWWSFPATRVSPISNCGFFPILGFLFHMFWFFSRVSFPDISWFFLYGFSMHLSTSSLLFNGFSRGAGFPCWFFSQLRAFQRNLHWFSHWVFACSILVNGFSHVVFPWQMAYCAWCTYVETNASVRGRVVLAMAHQAYHCHVLACMWKNDPLVQLGQSRWPNSLTTEWIVHGFFTIPSSGTHI